MTPPIPPVPPEDDIGPFYKVLAAILTVAAVVLLVLHAQSERAYTWVDVGMVGVLGSLILALIRPRWFDGLVKGIADKLPFFKFEK